MRIRKLNIKFQNCFRSLFVVAAAMFVAGETHVHAQSTSQTSASESPLAKDFTIGTLPYYLSTNLVGYAKGHTPDSDDQRTLANWHYADYQGTNFHLLTNVTWSPTFWLHGVKGLTATAIGYSNGTGAQTLITMISPRHYLLSTHTHPEGLLTAFLDTNNILYWRKMLGRIELANDTSVGILNADLPPSVGFLPVLPANFSDYLPTNVPVLIQGIGMNQDARLFSQPMTFGFPPYVVWASDKTATFGLGTNWNIAIRGGDSSNPDMLLIGNQLVLVSHNLSIQAGPNYALQINAINQAMHELSIKNHVHSDYQLTTFPLTNWPKLR